MKKYYLTSFFIVMISALLISCGGKKVQKTAPSFEPYKFNASQYVPKVDTFVVILDTSYSMAEKWGNKAKADIAKDFLTAMNQTIPEMNYNGALRTFGNIAYVPDKSTLLLYGPTKYSTAGFGKALNAVKGSNGDSSRALAKAIIAAGGDLKSAQGPVNVIIVSDGENMDQVPVKAAEALKSQFGDRLCIYTVLIGDSPAGKDILDQIAKAGGCGYSTTADKLASSGDMAGFVEGIFLAIPAPKPAPVAKPMDSDGDGVTDDKDQCPNTPMGATVDARGCWTYAAVVLFGFDSAEIKSEAHPMLDEASAILKKNSEINVEVDGHTDNIGPAEYNMKLSERRANAVMEYFVSQGVDAKRLTIKGFGLTKPASTNDTKEGRAKNRRVELTPVK
ncbi:OmpA family protein [Thermodesulfobacteriota bacterium]